VRGDQRRLRRRSRRRRYGRTAARPLVDAGDFRQAIGELVTCSRCGGTSSAAAGFASLTDKANELERQRPAPRRVRAIVVCSSSWEPV
jgi:hypothetical protein